jgi:hypothetical protein
VANLDTLGSFVEQGKTVTKETTVADLNKTQEAKGKISMVKAIIRDLLLEDKLVRMWKEESFILFVGDGMYRTHVGPKFKIMVVVIVEEIILQRVSST